MALELLKFPFMLITSTLANYFFNIL